MKINTSRNLIIALILALFSAENVNANDDKFVFSPNDTLVSFTESSPENYSFNLTSDISNSNLFALQFVFAFWSGIAVASPEVAGGIAAGVSTLLISEDGLSSGLTLLTIGAINAFELSKSKYSNTDIFSANMIYYNLILVGLPLIVSNTSLTWEDFSGYSIHATEEEFGIRYAIHF